MLNGHYVHRDYPRLLRRITALVEINGNERAMVFLTNNNEWAPCTAGKHYRCCWSIERVVKELKQTVQLVDFFGHCADAVKWLVWTALRAYLLRRLLPWQRQWAHSLTRLVSYIRGAL